LYFQNQLLFGSFIGTNEQVVVFTGEMLNKIKVRRANHFVSQFFGKVICFKTCFGRSHDENLFRSILAQKFCRFGNGDRPINRLLRPIDFDAGATDTIVIWGSSRVDLQACKLGTGPSFYNVVTGKTLALPNLIALQHIPLSPAGV
jgi:hypothetical protein